MTRPLTREEVGGEYEAETGRVIADTVADLGLSAVEMPAILVASHGPFTWGHDAGDAVANAVALEAVAAMASETLKLNPSTPAVPEYLLEKHYLRKHGPNAYYGQRKR